MTEAAAEPDDPAHNTVGSHAPRTGVVVPVLAFAGVVVSLMQTLVIPLVPKLPELLSAPSSDAAWAITATLLAGAVATPVVGRLGDMYGKRRMLLVSLGVLVTGSVICAQSNGAVVVDATRPVGEVADDITRMALPAGSGNALPDGPDRRSS